MSTSERAIATTYRHLYGVPDRCGDGDPAPDETGVVSVASLTTGLSIRDQAGAESEPTTLTDPAGWQPIVVARATRAVVDGHRRVRTAKALGISRMNVRWFDGDEADAIVEFIRLNMSGEVGLGRSERSEAARRMLCLHPDWSDRRIGELCRIPPKTVGDVRATLRETVGGIRVNGTEARIGRDGRVRPLDARAQRARIAAAIKENPRGSLRAIAGPIGVSPETVRRVRASMAEQGCLDRDPRAPAVVQGAFTRRRERTWRADSAFTSRNDAAEVAEFFERTDTSAVDPEEHSRAVPLSRIYEVADEARRRAAFWLRFADSVENRSRRACY